MIEPFMNFDLFQNYTLLKLIIIFLTSLLVVITIIMFKRLRNDKKVKKKKLVFKDRILTYLSKYFDDPKLLRPEELEEMRKIYAKDKSFREVLMTELKSKKGKAKESKELYIKLGGDAIARKMLLSKHPLDIYQSLQEMELFNILPEKEILVALQKYPNERISILASCLLFKCNKKIVTEDILRLDPYLCPIVEMKIYGELERQNRSESEPGYINQVINDCLKTDISTKMRAFLMKTLILINNTKTH